MSGGEAVAAEALEDEAGKEAELHRLIAADAGIRSPAAKVFGPDVVDDFALPFLREIEYVKLDAEPFRGKTGFGERLRLVGATQRHGDSDDFMTLLLQDHRRESRIHAARYADRDLHIRIT